MNESMTFWQLMREGGICIPVLQREYAQGRLDAQTMRIRADFLRSLSDACFGGRPLYLDYIYGTCAADGAFVPFDGQQRLTTLFLLHLWAAVQSDVFEQEAPFFAGFTYQTRDDAEIFLRGLTGHFSRKPQLPEGSLRDDICAHAWYRTDWDTDPTITGMLVMLNDIHRLFSSRLHEYSRPLWDVLTSSEPAPVTFSCAHLDGLSATADEVYIKMNARGKQLTGFERFKASFTQIFDDNGRFDNEWINFFWQRFHKDFPPCDKSENVDACFEAFLRFLTEMFHGYASSKRHEQFDDKLFEKGLADAIGIAVHLPREQALGKGLDPMPNSEFLCSVLDALASAGATKDAAQDLFERFFTKNAVDRIASDKRAVWFDASVDLLGDCCRESQSGAQSLLLLAFLIVLADGLDGEPEISLRLRTLRNFLTGSGIERGSADWAGYIEDVCFLIRHGPETYLSASGKKAFSEIRREEEKAKMELRAIADENTTQALEYLEDHDLLRGHLALFSRTEDSRVMFSGQDICDSRLLFSFLFPGSDVSTTVLIRALLSQGDYTRIFFNNRIHLGKLYEGESTFGFRHIFADEQSRNFAVCGKAVRTLAQLVAQNSCWTAADAARVLKNAADAFARECQIKRRYPWRYYFVRWPAMLPGSEDSSIYRVEGKKYFSLLKLRREKISAAHVDPFLLAAVEAAGITGYGGLERGQPVLFKNIRTAVEFGQTFLRVYAYGGRQLNKNLIAMIFDSSGALGEWKEYIAGSADNQAGQDPSEILINIPGSNSSHGVREYDTVDRILVAAALLRTVSRFTCTPDE